MKVRALVVVNWKRGRVHGMTTSDEQAREWVRGIMGAHRGDPLAATITVDVVEVSES